MIDYGYKPKVAEYSALRLAVDSASLPLSEGGCPGTVDRLKCPSGLPDIALQDTQKQRCRARRVTWAMWHESDETAQRTFSIGPWVVGDDFVHDQPSKGMGNSTEIIRVSMRL